MLPGPCGPQARTGRTRFAAAVGAPYALALASGTAALHLALIHAGVGPGDEVLVSTLTFSTSANPIAYLGARPTFIDSERTSWNLDPGLLAETLAARARVGKLPKAVVPVHLYGQSADMEPILAACARLRPAGHRECSRGAGRRLLGRGRATTRKIRKIRRICVLTPRPFRRHLRLGRHLLLQRQQDHHHLWRRDVAQTLKVSQTLRVSVAPQAFGADREAIRVALEQADIESCPLWKERNQRSLRQAQYKHLR